MAKKKWKDKKTELIRLVANNSGFNRIIIIPSVVNMMTQLIFQTNGEIRNRSLFKQQTTTRCKTEYRYTWTRLEFESQIKMANWHRNRRNFVLNFYENSNIRGSREYCLHFGRSSYWNRNDLLYSIHRRERNWIQVYVCLEFRNWSNKFKPSKNGFGSVRKRLQQKDIIMNQATPFEWKLWFLLYFMFFFFIGASNNVTDNQTIFGKRGNTVTYRIFCWKLIFFFQANQMGTFALLEMAIDVYIWLFIVKLFFRILKSW